MLSFYARFSVGLRSIIVHEKQLINKNENRRKWSKNNFVNENENENENRCKNENENETKLKRWKTNEN